VAAQVRLDAPPIDLALTEDERALVVLCEDGTLRAHALEGGAERGRIKLPGKGTALRRLAGDRVAVLGIATGLPVVSLGPWLAGKPESEYLEKLDVKSAVDVVTVGEAGTLVAATSQGNRLLRLSGPRRSPDGELALPGILRGLVATRAEGGDRLFVLLDGRLRGDSGAILVLDPSRLPLGGTRAAWSGATEPRASGGGLLFFDRAAAQLLSLGPAGAPRFSLAGPQPVAAFAWAGERAVVIGAGGEATVSALDRREVLQTIALGGLPTAAAMTPDGSAILVALGGGPRGRGATTAVLSGEPLRLEATLQTGEGAHAVAVGAGGRVAVVTATWSRAVAVLRRP
jgi:DNA-binding beta-propeller fold protein YncE